ncbi:Hypothetical predicted protein [Mytilus galloprovincialis]|uniref:Uncharacterized protein n=1 Tax=Mytilus galloprovincialis TaxID=29158 RepID=A0A8B6FB25_MYTGA|nr:Hypothetical predicted protein [Mytilus galloprovincialis]
MMDNWIPEKEERSLSTDSEDLGTRQRRRVIQPTSQVKHRLRRPWGQTATQSYTGPPHKLSTDSEDLGTRQRLRVIQPTSQVKYNSEDLGSRQRCGTARPHKLSTDSEDLGTRQRRRVTVPPHKLSTDGRRRRGIPDIQALAHSSRVQTEEDTEGFQTSRALAPQFKS